MTRIDAVCRRNDAAFVAVLLPQRFQLTEGEWDRTSFKFGLDQKAFDLSGPNRRVMLWCAEEGVNCLDLLPAFRDARGENYSLSMGDMHWNSEGHRLAAYALAAHLVATVMGE